MTNEGNPASSSDTRPSFFSKAATAGIAFLISLGLVEFILRSIVGLGDPLIYRASPLFGYRLKENQLVERRGINIRVNNLGLRAESDWDTVRTGKILFLGNSVTFGGTYISNTDLFSHQAVANIPGFVSGNGGVNGWGVENIHALVVDGGFLPASVYVTVLQDMDFERGLSKFAGQPFWAGKPSCALEELTVFAAFRLFQVSKDDFEAEVPVQEREKTIERSVLRLKEMDEFLRSRGVLHLIYMSTDTDQLAGHSSRDSTVSRFLNRNRLEVSYLADRPELRGLSQEQINNLFYDWNHLDKEGHRLWGRIIGGDLQRILGSSTSVNRRPL